MTIWTPELPSREGPIYKTLADLLAQDIEQGRLQAGDRLPTHRDLARHLSVTVGTVTRAYAEAARRGLIGGEVGRGTFVRGDGLGAVNLLEPRDDQLVDLRHNIPVSVGLEEEFGPLLAEVASSAGLAELLNYQVHGGGPEHRLAGAEWIARSGFSVEPDRVLVTGGAQHGMAVTFATLTQPGDVVLTEALTYPGMKALANLLHLRLEGVEMDAHGLVPEALEAACRRGAKALYCMPTLHNPAGTVMPAERREHVATIAREYGLALVEDDSYGFLVPDAPAPLVSHAPELGYYVTSASKSMTPGLRIGYLAAPRDMVERLTSSLWAITYMSSPLMAEIAAQVIQSGGLERLVERKREEAGRRQALARRVLAGLNYDAYPNAFHLWLHLPEPWRGSDFVEQARARRVAVTPAEAFVVGREAAPHAVRVCLGAVEDMERLESGLQELAELLRGAPEPCCSVV